MLDNQNHTIGDNGYQGNGNGYDQLDGDWALYYKVAKGFTHKVMPDDRQDFLHDLMLVMARVKAKYDQIGKPLTQAGLIRVAAYEVSGYWRRHYRLTNGIDCGNCTKKQRAKCKENWLYSECPKAIKLESLDKLVEDGNGGSTPLHELIADDNATDLVARLDARFTIQSYPHKFVRIAYKKYAGYPLNGSELNYYYRQLKKAQKSLV